MEVKFLKPEQYDKWNQFVDSSPQGDIFCYSWWLDAITNSRFKIIAILNEDVILAGMPLALDSQNKVNIPPITRTSGILFSYLQNTTPRTMKSLERKWTKALISSVNPDDFVQMCFHHTFTDWLPFKWKGFSQTTRYTYLINYRFLTIADLWEKTDLDHQRIIRKAEEKGITVSVCDDFELVYKYEELTFNRQGLKFMVPYNDLKSLDNAIKKRDKRVIFRATGTDGTVHSVLYVAFSQKSACALLSGSDPELRNQGGHTLIMWEAIKYFYGKVNYFNMGGSDIEKIEAHLKGFGGTLTQYFLIFNDRQLRNQRGIRSHLNEIAFHIIETLKLTGNKIAGYLKIRKKS